MAYNLQEYENNPDYVVTKDESGQITRITSKPKAYVKDANQTRQWMEEYIPFQLDFYQGKIIQETDRSTYSIAGDARQDIYITKQIIYKPNETQIDTWSASGSSIRHIDTKIETPTQTTYTDQFARTNQSNELKEQQLINTKAQRQSDTSLWSGNTFFGSLEQYNRVESVGRGASSPTPVQYTITNQKTAGQTIKDIRIIESSISGGQTFNLNYDPSMSMTKNAMDIKVQSTGDFINNSNYYQGKPFEIYGEKYSFKEFSEQRQSVMPSLKGEYKSFNINGGLKSNILSLPDIGTEFSQKAFDVGVMQTTNKNTDKATLYFAASFIAGGASEVGSIILKPKKAIIDTAYSVKNTFNPAYQSQMIYSVKKNPVGFAGGVVATSLIFDAGIKSVKSFSPKYKATSILSEFSKEVILPEKQFKITGEGVYVDKVIKETKTSFVLLNKESVSKTPTQYYVQTTPKYVGTSFKGEGIGKAKLTGVDFGDSQFSIGTLEKGKSKYIIETTTAKGISEVQIFKESTSNGKIKPYASTKIKANSFIEFTEPLKLSASKGSINMADYRFDMSQEISTSKGVSKNVGGSKNIKPVGSAILYSEDFIKVSSEAKAVKGSGEFTFDMDSQKVLKTPTSFEISDTKYILKPYDVKTKPVKITKSLSSYSYSRPAISVAEQKITTKSAFAVEFQYKTEPTFGFEKIDNNLKNIASKFQQSFNNELSQSKIKDKLNVENEFSSETITLPQETKAIYQEVSVVQQTTKTKPIKSIYGLYESNKPVDFYLKPEKSMSYVNSISNLNVKSTTEKLIKPVNTGNMINEMFVGLPTISKSSNYGIDFKKSYVNLNLNLGSAKQKLNYTSISSSSGIKSEQTSFQTSNLRQDIGIESSSLNMLSSKNFINQRTSNIIFQSAMPSGTNFNRSGFSYRPNQKSNFNFLPPKLPSFDSGITTKKKSKSSKVKIKDQYTVDLSSQLFDIYGKKPTKWEISTGLIRRPKLN